MRAIVQRVNSASVSVEGSVVGSCGRGCLILLGVGREDGEDEVEQLWRKIWNLRIFDDDAGKTNLSLADIDGDVLVVSQFTLYANCRHGRRPSFTDAGDPASSEKLYEQFVERARCDAARVETGVFGAAMKVSLVNDGPFTLFLDTDDLRRSRSAS